MTDLVTRPPLWAAADPISNGPTGFRQRDVIRAGLIAGGLAFSVALLLASIQQPSTPLDLLKPKPALSGGDSTATETSSVPSGAASSIATILVDRFRDSSSHELMGAGEFLDFVQGTAPSLLMNSSGGPSRQVRGLAAAVMTPQLAFEPQTTASPPANNGGGGGGAFAGGALGPVGGLPVWWDIWAWADLFSAPAIDNLSNGELPLTISPPAFAAPVTPAPVTPAPGIAIPVLAPSLSPSPTSPPPPALPSTNEHVTVSPSTGALQIAPGGISNQPGITGANGNPGRGPSASGNGSGSGSTQQTKPSHTPKKPDAVIKPPKPGSGTGGSDPGSSQGD